MTHFKIVQREQWCSLENNSILLLSFGREIFNWFLGVLNRRGAACNLIYQRAGRHLLFGHLALSLLVVLGQVAVLAHTRGVMRLVSMAADSCHLSLTLSMVAVVAHVLGVVLPVWVRALSYLHNFILTGWDRIFSLRTWAEFVLGVVKFSLQEIAQKIVIHLAWAHKLRHFLIDFFAQHV